MIKKAGFILLCVAVSLSAVPFSVLAEDAAAVPVVAGSISDDPSTLHVTDFTVENAETSDNFADADGADNSDNTVDTAEAADSSADPADGSEQSGTVAEEDPETQPADENTDRPSSYKTGVYKINGKYKYYENGRFSKKTGVVRRASDKRYVYVENGIFRRITGVVRRISDKKYVYVSKGVFKKKTGIARRIRDGKFVYVRKGIFRKSTGLAKRISDGSWLYVKKGVFKKTSGHTTAIDNYKKILYFENGKRIKSTKKFTGVYRGKCYKNNRCVDHFSKKDWISFLGFAKNQRSLTITNGKLSKKKLAKLKAAMSRYASAASSYGFIALNTKTGLMISYNPDMMLFGASTIKAPYVAALCKYNAKGVKGKKTMIHKTLKYSSNGNYNALFRRYGTAPINRLMREADVNGMVGSQGYRDTSARQLAKQWCVIKDYMDKDGKNVDLLRKNLLTHKKGKTITDYYKKGWMEPGSWCGGILNCAGCGDDWVYGIVSGYGITMPSAKQDALISVLAAVIK